MVCGEADDLRTDAGFFASWLKPLRKAEWVVYAKRPFAGPGAVLAYLSRYTHRVAIAKPTSHAAGRMSAMSQYATLGIEKFGAVFAIRCCRPRRPVHQKQTLLIHGIVRRRWMSLINPTRIGVARFGM